MGAGLIAFLATIVGLLVAASDGRRQVATRTYTAAGGLTSSSTTAPAAAERYESGLIAIADN